MLAAIACHQSKVTSSRKAILRRPTTAKEVEMITLSLWFLFLSNFLRVQSNTVESIYKSYNETRGLNHYLEYGSAYDENIAHIRGRAQASGKKVKMLEMGVQSGGSTRVWKRYFGNKLDYIGIDINRNCKQFESLDEGIKIEIGSQLDQKFISGICEKYGPFDFIVDDGGHATNMIMTSLNILWRCLTDGAVYVIEDLHMVAVPPKWMVKEARMTTDAAGQTGGQSRPHHDTFGHLANWARERSPYPGTLPNMDLHSAHLHKMVFYDSMVFLYYVSTVPKLTSFRIGNFIGEFG